MKRLFFIALFLAAGFSAAFAQNEAQTVAMIELVKKEPITVRQFKTKLTPLEQARGRPYSVAERRTLLEDFVNQRLVLQAAERDKIAVTENEINAALRESLTQQSGRTLTDAEFEQAKRQWGTDAREQLLMQKYLMAKKKDQIDAVKPPTDADVLNWYNLNKVKMIRPDTVCLSLISVPYGPDAASKAKAKEIADRLGRDIGGNVTKFDEAVLKGQTARTRAGSTPEAGYVSSSGVFVSRTEETQKEVGERFLTTAFSLKQGEVSSLIETGLAYQFVKVTASYPQKALELDDPIDPVNPITVKEYIQQGIRAESLQAAVDQAFRELVNELRKSRNVVTIYEQYLNW
jgi:parvulin-like peptidyl-prolyl isomerase